LLSCLWIIGLSVRFARFIYFYLLYKGMSFVSCINGF